MHHLRAARLCTGKHLVAYYEVANMLKLASRLQADMLALLKIHWCFRLTETPMYARFGTSSASIANMK